MRRPARAADEARDTMVESVLARMRAQGGRVTSARRLMLVALACQGAHLTAEDLAVEVRARLPDLNLSTIYRNLEELQRLGIVQAHSGPGPATYHLASERHGHLVCESCGSLTEVSDRIFARLAGQIRGEFGFTIDPHRFALTGRCASCQP